MYNAQIIEPELEPPSLPAFHAAVKPFQAQFLEASDIPAFIDLQNRVRALLPEDKKHHLKERFAEDLLLHLSERMPMIGVKNEGGNIIAQCLVSYPKNSDAVRNLKGYPIAPDSECVISVVQSLCVAPEHAGKGLSSLLLSVAKDVAAKDGHLALLAKVADDNTQSRKSFLNNAFTIAGKGFDPVKNYPVSYLKYSVYGCNAS